MTAAECDELEQRIYPHRRAFWASWFAEVRRKRVNGIPWREEQVRQHGISGYDNGCRCKICKGTKTASNERARQRQHLRNERTKPHDSGRSARPWALCP